MEVAKGKRQEDGTYLYTCGKCHGKGIYGSAVCDWCYALDLDKCREAFKVARGKQYYSLLKAILSIIGKEMRDAAMDMKAQHGLTIADLGYFALRFDMNFKATVEWLDECSVLKSGVYERLMRSTIADPVTGKNRNFKVGDALNAAREKYPEMDKTA